MTFDGVMLAISLQGTGMSFPAAFLWVTQANQRHREGRAPIRIVAGDDAAPVRFNN